MFAFAALLQPGAQRELVAADCPGLLEGGLTWGLLDLTLRMLGWVNPCKRSSTGSGGGGVASVCLYVCVGGASSVYSPSGWLSTHSICERSS